MRSQTAVMNQWPLDRVRKGSMDLTPLKVTALSYLREARIHEHYETMDELVRHAQEFGADPREVADALAAPR